MRRVAALILLTALPLYASMSDPAARRKAIGLWGKSAMIGPVLTADASNWDRWVGINTAGCQADFTVLGKGFNTWDAAFDDYDAKIASGKITIPNVTGMIHFPYIPLLNPVGYTVQWIVDGAPYGTAHIIPIGETGTSIMDVNTDMLTPGFHSACVSVSTGISDSEGSRPLLFNVVRAAARPATAVR